MKIQIPFAPTASPTVRSNKVYRPHEAFDDFRRLGFAADKRYSLGRTGTTSLMPTQRIHNVLALLAERRPVFHSEADFQHALAWQMHLSSPDADIRLEKQVATGGTRVHLDLLLQSAAGQVAIELKYKTRSAKLSHANEDFFLRNQSAQDIGRHDFLKDIQRLEKYVEEHPRAEGFAILLTNDRSYWMESKKKDSVDSEFRVHEGRVLRGGATWGVKASAGTKHKREEPINLKGSYKVQWVKYFSFGLGIADEFRYALLRVPSAA